MRDAGRSEPLILGCNWTRWFSLVISTRLLISWTSDSRDFSK